MIEKAQLKTQGLEFARSLQMVFKIALLYSINHTAVSTSLEQSYAALTSLLEVTKPFPFTFGFANQRVLLNNLLTTDTSLGPLGKEFSKRGIGAVCFLPDLTRENFKQGLGLLGAKPEAIEQAGGIRTFLDQNPIQGMRILPAGQQEKEGEDTELEMDAESFLAGQYSGEKSSGPGLRGLDILLQSAGIEMPDKMPDGGGGLFALADQAARTAIVDLERDPRVTVAALSRVLEELTPENLISALPASRRTELKGRPAQEVATELAENMAVEWAAKRLSASPGDTRVAEDEVVQVLSRVVKATEVPERLLGKLGRYMEASNLPSNVGARVRQELTWFVLTREEKADHLTRLECYGAQDFQHLLGFIEDRKKEGAAEDIARVSDHYFSVLVSAPGESRAEELVRTPELIRAIAGSQTSDLLPTLVERLFPLLTEEEDSNPACHERVANCLAEAACRASEYDDFEFTHRIGAELGRSRERDKAGHTDCCGQALERVLSSSSIERLVDLCLEKHDEPGWLRKGAALLKWAGREGIEAAFRKLEDEGVAANRLRLLRMIGRLGSDAIQVARTRLEDERWYVVRNACNILGELGDPELPWQLGEALRHSDGRVQQAAVTSIVKSRTEGRGMAMAEALPHLQPHLTEAVLDELTVLKDASAVEWVEAFIFQTPPPKATALEKVIQVLSAISAENAVEVLGKVLSDTERAPSVRKSALGALNRNSSDRARQLLAAFARLSPDDPLAAGISHATGGKSK